MGWSLHHPTGLIYYAPQSCYRGYTLYSNLWGHDANLIDMEGRICHRWHLDQGIQYGYLLPNGNLLMLTGWQRPPEVGEIEAGQTEGAQIPVGPVGLGGSAGSLVELDWESNVVWEYRNSFLHHDFQRLPNGNTLALLWEALPAEVAAQVQGGYYNDGEPEQMFGDVVQEITPQGVVLDQWRSFEHLDFEEDVICPLENRREWTHGNTLNVTAEGDLLVSYRSTSTIGIVDRSTGAFRWKWGPGAISHQHQPTYLENGRILLFDNGSHRLYPSTNYSRVIEVDPASNEVVWDYRGDPPISFYSYQISGAQRLPNGNTLICEGAPGRFFEVTPKGQIVWEFINPLMAASGQVAGGTVSGQANSVFRAHRYGPDHPALVGKDLDPDRYANLNRLYAAGS